MYTYQLRATDKNVDIALDHWNPYALHPPSGKAPDVHAVFSSMGKRVSLN